MLIIDLLNIELCNVLINFDKTHSTPHPTSGKPNQNSASSVYLEKPQTTTFYRNSFSSAYKK